MKKIFLPLFFFFFLAIPAQAHAQTIGTFDIENPSYNPVTKVMNFDIESTDPSATEGLVWVGLHHFNDFNGLEDYIGSTASEPNGCNTYGHCEVTFVENFGTSFPPSWVNDMQITVTGTSGNYWRSESFSLGSPPPEAKILATPSTGSKTVGAPFTINVIVSSQYDTTEPFNAARATVAVSSNLTINSISTPSSNPCNFQYTQTPTTANPSFAGAIYGGSATTCNAYTMVLTPNAEGTGTITFTNGSVKTYADNSEIFSGVQNASFTLTNGTEPTPTPMLEFQVTSPLQTYKTDYTLGGTKLSTITSIFVNGSDDDTEYPSATTWEFPATLSLGNNNFTVYGSDGSNQTATQTVTVDRHILGDINGDGEIDLIDASLFAVDWDKTEDLTYVLSDMNDDGVVDLTDLSILAKLQD